MKNKNKINEQPSGIGDTSNTTSVQQMGKSQKPMVAFNSASLKKPKVQKAISDLEKDKVGIQVVEESLEYLSEVKDAESGQISKPFTIGDKKYQMVRAITPKKERVMGVYSFNEVNDKGLNKIYTVEEFEKTIANKEKTSVKTEKMEKTDKLNQPYEGVKHFIVDTKLGKARKFKTIEELAKAQMTEDEKYMGIKEFKKYVDETLFGSSKRKSISETNGTDDGEVDKKMRAEAERLMGLITTKINQEVFDKVDSDIARREVIAAFAKLIGVPRTSLGKLISGLKDIADVDTSKPETSGGQAVTEGKKVLKTIKVKDIK
jgi:hypothetical protein